jgi:hypothetical protein
MIMLEMRYPEITKKMSTPMNPPGMNEGQAWKRMTIPTAIVLKPSISGRYEIG